jgi:hypothetical protein
MNFDHVIKILNGLLADNNSDTFNSSWIRKHAPHCYQFIYKNIRTELGHIDWDRVTFALDRKFQRRWVPGQKPKSRIPYEDSSEVAAVLKKYREKLYVFITCTNQDERRMQDVISIALVRLAQYGNLSAKKEIIKLIQYAIDDWIDRYHCLSHWRGYDEEIQRRLETCIRHYRYTGSFLNYVFLTLVYAGRSLYPLYECSLDEPIAFDSKRNKIENVVQDPETNEIFLYKRTHFDP